MFLRKTFGQNKARSAITECEQGERAWVCLQAPGEKSGLSDKTREKSLICNV